MILNPDIIIKWPYGCSADITTFTHEKITFCCCALFYLGISKKHLPEGNKFKAVPVKV